MLEVTFETTLWHNKIQIKGTTIHSRQLIDEVAKIRRLGSGDGCAGQ